jgi:hypothetical protein
MCNNVTALGQKKHFFEQKVFLVKNPSGKLKKSTEKDDYFSFYC